MNAGLRVYSLLFGIWGLKGEAWSTPTQRLDDVGIFRVRVLECRVGDV